MNTRLLGAAVLIALAVLFVPMFFSTQPPATGEQSMNLAIPQAPDRELQTRTLDLNGNGAAVPPGTTVQTPSPAAPGASSDRLATVNIGSNRPRDVETDPLAGKATEPTTVTTGSGASMAEPVIPMQGKATPAAPTPTPVTTPAKPTAAAARSETLAPAPAKPVATTTPPRPATPSAPEPETAAASGNYRLNLLAYANAANAAALQKRVQALGYTTSSHTITQAGKQLTQVMAGPFATRTAAEAARLKISQSVPGVQPRLAQAAESGSNTAAAAPASHVEATPTRAGGWAVQLAALGSQADANALRDKLRAAGFDGYVNPVQAGGRQLWQVRAGPQTQRADAQRVQDQIKAKLGIDGVVRQVP